MSYQRDDKHLIRSPSCVAVTYNYVTGYLCVLYCVTLCYQFHIFLSLVLFSFNNIQKIKIPISVKYIHVIDVPYREMAPSNVI